MSCVIRTDHTDRELVPRTAPVWITELMATKEGTQ